MPQLCFFCQRAEARLNIVIGAFAMNDALLKSILKISCKPHLINTFIKESQAGVFITDKGALLYETAEHLSLGHDGVKPLVGAVSAL